MSRLDNTFPPYEKLDIDPNEWPTAYWESCYTCENCDTNWPEDENFQVCPDCHTENKNYDFRPTYRWPEAVQKLLSARFESWYDEWDGMPNLDNEVKEKCLIQADEHQ